MSHDNNKIGQGARVSETCINSPGHIQSAICNAYGSFEECPSRVLHLCACVWTCGPSDGWNAGKRQSAVSKWGEGRQERFKGSSDDKKATEEREGSLAKVPRAKTVRAFALAKQAGQKCYERRSVERSNTSGVPR